MHVLSIIALASTALAGVSKTGDLHPRELNGYGLGGMQRRDHKDKGSNQDPTPNPKGSPKGNPTPGPGGSTPDPNPNPKPSPGRSYNPSYPCKTVADCAGQGGHKVPISDTPNNDPGQIWLDQHGIAVCKPNGQCDGKPPPGSDLVQVCKDIYNGIAGIKQTVFAGCMLDETSLVCEATCPCDGSCCTIESGGACFSHKRAVVPATYQCPGIKEPCAPDSPKFQLAKSDPNGLSGGSAPAPGSPPAPKNGAPPNPSNGAKPAPSNGAKPDPRNGSNPNPPKGTSPDPSPQPPTGGRGGGQGGGHGGQGGKSGGGSQPPSS